MASPASVIQRCSVIRVTPRARAAAALFPPARARAPHTSAARSGIGGAGLGPRDVTSGGSRPSRGPRFAERSHRPVFEQMEQVALGRRRGVRDLVQEQGSAMGVLERARLVAERPREGAGPVAHQEGQLQSVAERGQGLCDEGTVAAGSRTARMASDVPSRSRSGWFSFPGIVTAAAGRGVRRAGLRTLGASTATGGNGRFHEPGPPRHTSWNTFRRGAWPPRRQHGSRRRAARLRRAVAPT